MVKLAYSLPEDITTDAAGLYVRLLSGNSAFDPDPNIGGTQPTGFDQYSAFYRFYYVAGSKITLEVINVDDADCISFGIFPGTNQLSTGDLSSMDPDNWPYSQEKTLGPLTSSFSRARFKAYMSTKKLYGYPASTNSNFIAAVSANPTNQWYWNLYAVNIAAQAAQMRMKYKVTYYVTFFGRQEIAVS